MREHSFIINEALSNGLRPAGMGRGTPYCDKLSNLVPWGNMARTPEWPTFPVQEEYESGWPFPHLMRGRTVTLLRDETALSQVAESDWSVSEMTSYESLDDTEVFGGLNASDNDSQLAEFEECWFYANGGGLWARLPYVSDELLALVNDNGVATELVGVHLLQQYDSRLFLAAQPVSAWRSGTRFEEVKEVWRKTAPEHVFVTDELEPLSTANWLTWSEPNGGSDDAPFYAFLAMLGAWGTAGFDAVREVLISGVEHRRIGMMRLATQGDIQRLMPFGPGLLAFCTDGVHDIRWVQDAGYYSARPRPGGVTIANPSAIDGDSGEIVFVDQSGVLWRYWLEDQYFRSDKMEYGEYVGALDLANVRVMRDTQRGHYWIGDGETCYVLTQQGLGGPMDVCPTSVQIKDGAPLGYLFGGHTGTAEAVSGPFDINERGRKHITTFQIASTNLSDAYATMDYRYTSSGAFARGPLRPVNPEGVAYPNISFVDGRAVVQGNVTGSAEIERIEVRYQNEDRRARRGTKGVPEEN